MLIEHRDEILSQFKCQNSGNCCRYPGYVYIKESSIADIANHLNISSSNCMSKYVRQHKGWPIIASKTFRPNCFLDKQNNCKIYPHRPDHCKTYPNWDSIWASDTTLIEESNLCPGLKKAIDIYKNK